MALNSSIKAVLRIGVKDGTVKGLRSIKQNLHQVQVEARKAAALPKFGPSLPPGIQRGRDLALERSRDALRRYRKELRAELPAVRAANLKRSLATLQRSTQRSAQKMKAHLSGAFSGLGRGALIGGAAIGFGVKGMIETASAFERLRVTLETVEGSSEKANKSFKWVEEFAKESPFTLQETTDAFVRMRLRGMDPMNGSLKTFSDTAAAMASSGKKTTDVVEAIADAVTGENERLKEFGVKASKEGNFFVYRYDGKDGPQAVKALAKDSAAIRKVLTGVFESQFGGTGAKLAKTMSGTLTNIGDTFSRFQNMVFESGVGGGIKKELESLLGTLNRMEKSGELKAFAIETSKALSEMLQIAKEVFQAVREAVNAVGGLGNALKLAGGLFAVKTALQFGLAGASALSMGRDMQTAAGLAVPMIGKMNSLAGKAGLLKGALGSVAAFSFGFAIGNWIEEVTGFGSWLGVKIFDMVQLSKRFGNEMFEIFGNDDSGIKRFGSKSEFDAANKAIRDEDKRKFAEKQKAQALAIEGKRLDEKLLLEVDIKAPPGMTATSKVKTKKRGKGPNLSLDTGSLKPGGSL